jgi:hypothetical protein
VKIKVKAREVRRMAVQGYPVQNIRETPISPNGWTWWCSCHPATQRSTNRITVQVDPGIEEDPISKK